jgi:hypothetical protein
MEDRSKIYIIGKDCESDPLDGSCLTFYEKDYSPIYTIFSDSGFNIYPSFTSKNYEYGKALIFDDKNEELLARYTSNGNLIIFNYEKVEEKIAINRFDYTFFKNGVFNLLDFLKSIKVLTSFDKKFVNNLDSLMSVNNVLNSTFRVSRNNTFFMDDMIGNKSFSKIVNVSKTIKLSKGVFTEFVSFKFFHSFNIVFLPFEESIKLEFELNAFKAYCLINDGNYDRIAILFKKMVKKYLATRKSIEFEMDYIFTKEFFEEYEILNEMIAY